MLALYEHSDNERNAPSKITASSLPDPRTGVDLFTTITLDFEKLTARANCEAATSTQVLLADVIQAPVISWFPRHLIIASGSLARKGTLLA